MVDDRIQNMKKNASRKTSWQLLPGTEFRFFQFCAQNILFRDFALCSLKSSHQNITFEKKDHRNWLKIGKMRANQSFQVERYLFSDYFAHKISSVRHILIILASK